MILRAEVGNLRGHVAPKRRRVEARERAHGGCAGFEEPTTEGPPGGHLDQSVVEYADPAVMGKDRRPTGNRARGGEDARERREDTNVIDGAHQRLRPA